MSKTYNVEDISYIVDLNDEPNEDMDEELVDDLEVLGHDKEGHDGRSSTLRRRKTSLRREFSQFNFV
jgi:hypothetical protein